MLENLRISDGLIKEIEDDACGIMLSILDQKVYSQDNKIIPIRIVRGQMVDHLSGLYTKRISGEDPTILAKETLHTIVEWTATELGYERRYVQLTSERGQPLEGKILELEEIEGNPKLYEYWVRN